MTLNPNGGVQSIKVPFRPLVGIGEGTIVQVDEDDGVAIYAEVISASVEKRGGATGLYLMVRPVPVGTLLTGFGTFCVDVRPIEVIV